MKRQLIVTADDFGLTEGVNRAIVLAHRSGVVTSASLMVDGAAFESAVRFARETPRLDIGLHLTLTHNPLQFATALARGKIRVAEVEAEICRQIEKAIGTGLTISHIDGHKHVHVIPQVLRIVRDVAPAYGIASIRPMKTRTPAIASLLRRNSGQRISILKQYALGKAAWSAWMLTKPGMVGPRRFYGVAETGFLDLQAFATIIDRLGPGVNELMCHPGYADEELSKTPTRLQVQRERELRLLTSPELRCLIEKAGIELISYRDL